MLGSVGQTHRVTRRKSMSSANATQLAAVAAAVHGAADLPSAVGTATPMTISNRRSLTTKTSGSPSVAGKTHAKHGSTGLRALPSPHRGTDDIASPDGGRPSRRTSVVVDEQHHQQQQASPLWSPPLTGKAGGKVRSRRASEGSHLRTTGSRRETGNELRCETCGKAYKHSSCLTKHLFVSLSLFRRLGMSLAFLGAVPVGRMKLRANVMTRSWEHTPEWSFTSKLLMSKHQQVQLLEAASVLVAMNQDGDAVVDAPTDANGHPSSSDSPDASGSSASRDGMSSVHTSPPPPAEDEYAFMFSAREHRARAAKRRSSNASTHSRSHQSVYSISTHTDGTSPGTPGFYLQGPGGADWKTAGVQVDDDAADLAAAVGLLSCSFGTPKTGPLGPSDEIPPVPPLPARYTNLPSQDLSGHKGLNMAEQAGRPYSISQRGPGERKSAWRPGDGEDVAVDDEADDRPSGIRSRVDEDDESIFGRMEE